MSAHLKYNKVGEMRARSKIAKENYTRDFTPKRPIAFRPSKDTTSDSLLTYIRSQKSSRGKRVKVTLAKTTES